MFTREERREFYQVLNWNWKQSRGPSKLTLVVHRRCLLIVILTGQILPNFFLHCGKETGRNFLEGNVLLTDAQDDEKEEVGGQLPQNAFQVLLSVRVAFLHKSCSPETFKIIIIKDVFFFLTLWMAKEKHKIDRITFKGDSPIYFFIVIFFLACSECNWEIVLAGVQCKNLAREQEMRAAYKRD